MLGKQRRVIILPSLEIAAGIYEFQISDGWLYIGSQIN